MRRATTTMLQVRNGPTPADDDAELTDDDAEPELSVGRAGASEQSGSVGNALRILLLLRDSPIQRVADVARELDVARSTAHRLLAMLEHHGFVRQQPGTKAYVAGPTLVDVGLDAMRNFDLRTVTRPALEALRDETSESVALLLLESREVVVLDTAASRQRLRVVERVGDRSPAHLTAAGKAILAVLPQSEFYQLYPSQQLNPTTPRSAQTRTDLEDELARIRLTGYATNLEESSEGFVGIGSAIVHGTEGPIGAVSIALPSARSQDDLGAVYGAALQRSISAIEFTLP
jgi:IclR family transcriptional regulator, acetate operon repressor